MSASLPPSRLWSLAFLVCLLGPACGGAEEERPASASVPSATRVLPSHRPQAAIPDPDPKVRRMTEVEVLSESVSASFSLLASKLLVRDFEGAREWLRPDFRGDDVFAIALVGRPGRLGTRRSELSAGAAPPVGRDEWLRSLERRIGGWRRVHQARLKIKQADFLADEGVSWGKARLQLRLLGTNEAGGRELFEALFQARIEHVEAGWQLSRLLLESGRLARSERELFVDVSSACGVAHTGIRYGRPGNDSDAWNGAAAGDVDGDGRFDIFIPSSLQNFLYWNDGRGGFREEARERGLSAPAGGTGAVFFDFDNDGDQDLFVSQVGWLEADRRIGGATWQLYRNGGTGSFENVTAAFGLDRVGHGYSVCVFDYDADGFLDLFVCGYGRMERELNDSWLEASNGSPNVLLRNLGGERFVDVTAEAGLDDHRWSYAAAVADADRDGDLDLYVANNFGSNRLYRNEGDGSFRDVAPELGVAERGNSMGVVWGDVSGDGILDLFVASHASSVGSRILERIQGSLHQKTLSALHAMAAGNALFRGGDGFRRLQDCGAEDAGWVWGAAMSDFDLDGALDLYCANGFVTGDLPEDT